MTVHPRLVRSVPFWLLIVGSVATIGGGVYVLVDKLTTMEAAILDGTATGVDVYVGQVWGVFGGILVGAGALGLALALAVAAVRAGLTRRDADSAHDEHGDSGAHTVSASAPATTAVPAHVPAGEAHDTPASPVTSDVPASPEPTVSSNPDASDASHR
ncbi:dinucleotide-utilizing enzyme [Microbacterium thalli]|uniref:Dinucleotide-utilizing enzyme n=1 Tax=Microbacterium thalli TaxID=3027921 RepID=A0ABT5SI23_9MICO|nr:dinucleotide-utilizing enzyme [Microbacterium thalli]MDD7962455.1 dinucleotide-utilizing enzyme [Microbacterium thalli]